MMLPMSFNDGWSSEFLTWEDMFQKGKETYEMMVRPFKNFGIREKNISWLNYFQDTSTAAKKMIAQADIVVLSGESPAWIMQRIEDNS
ncbi:MAG: hypothetical protein MR283_06275 [Erysipelotrichaceae bacterium]|nr:hypothetical protein [Erysipelotrichaceae bacterium]